MELLWLWLPGANYCCLGYCGSHTTNIHLLLLLLLLVLLNMACWGR
jgi:hypothetical protein